MSPARLPTIDRIFRFVERAGPTFIKKHPELVAGGAGVGLGMIGSRDPAQKLESDLMREYIGAPGAKYSFHPMLEKFAEHKMFLATRLYFEKYSQEDEFIAPFEKGVETGLGKGIVSEGLGALRRLIGATAQAIKERFVEDPKRDILVREVVKKDPDIRTFERTQPGQAMQAYRTMVRFAPTLSTDPQIVQSFLRNAAISGGPMDYHMVKGLADAEAAVHRAKSEGAWLRGGF